MSLHRRFNASPTSPHKRSLLPQEIERFGPALLPHGCGAPTTAGLAALDAAEQEFQSAKAAVGRTTQEIRAWWRQAREMYHLRATDATRRVEQPDILILLGLLGFEPRTKGL